MNMVILSNAVVTALLFSDLTILFFPMGAIILQNDRVARAKIYLPMAYSHFFVSELGFLISLIAQNCMTGFSI